MNDEAASTPSVRPWLRRAAWLGVVGGGLFATYMALGVWVVPRVVAAQIPVQGQVLLGRTPTVGAVQFDPLRLRLVIDDLAAPNREDRPMVSVSRLTIDVALWSSLRHRALHFDEIDIDTPFLEVLVREDGSLDLLDALPDPPAEGAPHADPMEIPPIEVATLAIHDGWVAVEDRTRDFRTGLAPITFTLVNFSTRGDENRAEATGTSQQGEHFEWQGTLRVSPLGSDGHVEVRDLRVSTVDDLLVGLLPVRLVGGRISGGGDYVLTWSDGLALDVSVPEGSVTDLEVGPVDADETWVRVPAGTARGIDVSLVDQRVAIGEIVAERPWMTAWRGADGTLNLERLNYPPEWWARPSKGDPWRVTIDSLDLRGGTVQVADRTFDEPLELTIEAANAVARGFDSDDFQHVALSVDARVGSGRMAGAGNLSLAPIAVDLQVEADQVDITPADRYLRDLWMVRIANGNGWARGRLRAQVQKETPRVLASFDGELAADSLRIFDRVNRQDLARIGRADVHGVQFVLEPLSFESSRVVLKRPFFRAHIDEQQRINLIEALSPPPGSQGPSSDDLPPMSIRRVLLEGGSAQLSDLSLQPPFSADVFDLVGVVKDLSTTRGTIASIDLVGSVDRYAPVTVTGQVDPFGYDHFADVRLTFENMELTLVDPYVGKYGGYRVERGKMSTRLHYEIRDRELKATHRVVVDGLKLGEKTHSRDRFKLPVKLGVALLKDKHGVIDVELPVQGSLDDPEFKLGKVVLKAIGTLIEKLVTAPFQGLAQLVGGGPELGYVDFAPGSAALSPEAVDKLGKLRAALVERPELRLDVPITVDGGADGQTLAAREVEWRLTSLRGGLPPGDRPPAFELVEDPKERRKLLVELFELEHDGAPELPPGPAGETAAERVDREQAWLAAEARSLFPASELELHALGRDRARAVQGQIVDAGEVEPERVFVTADRAPQEKGGMLRMELKLE